MLSFQDIGVSQFKCLTLYTITLRESIKRISIQYKFLEALKGR